MSEFSLFVVDDEEPLAKGVAMTLGNRYRTRTFFSAHSLLDALRENICDLLLLDIGLPDMNGIDVLKQVKKNWPEIAVIMITAFDQVETVVSAMKAGAHDYIVKPVQPDSLEITVDNAVETIRLRKEIRELQERYLQENMPFFIGESRETHDVMQFVQKVAASPDTPVLILGESGTGKELIAAAIHYRSPRFRAPLVSINCAAIPDNLMESELFGYEKGAFSGASVKGKKGLIEQADGGTLFLDEIADLSPASQAKFLRFLESGKFYKVGGTRELSVDVRIVSATNKDIESMVAKDTFRDDLWYRISVVKIEVPSLSERADDILLIARHFLLRYADKFSKKIKGFSSDAENILKTYPWRGNVRELKNVVERAVLITNGTELNSEDLGLPFQVPASGSRNNPDRSGYPDAGNTHPVRIPPQGIDLPMLIEAMEKQYIRAALDMSRGNESGAAELLNVKYSTFRYHRRKLGIN